MVVVQFLLEVANLMRCLAQTAFVELDTPMVLYASLLGVKAAEECGPAGSLPCAMCYASLMLSCIYMGSLDAANTYYQRSTDLLRRLKADKYAAVTVEMGLLLNNRAVLDMYMGRWDTVRFDLAEAYEIHFHNQSHQDAQRSILILALMYRLTGSFPKSSALFARLHQYAGEQQTIFFTNSSILGFNENQALSGQFRAVMKDSQMTALMGQIEKEQLSHDMVVCLRGKTCVAYVPLAFSSHLCLAYSSFCCLFVSLPL